MMALQNDNMNLLAKQVLPYIIEVISKNQVELTSTGGDFVKELRGWNYINDSQLIAPTIFQRTWDNIYSSFWSKISKGDSTMAAPSQYTVATLLKSYPDLQRSRGVTPVESTEDLIGKSVATAIKEMDDHSGMATWGKYKDTKVRHWAKLEAFDVGDISVGGYKHIVNAADGTNGPSWRMIVQLGARPKAYGIYPGGQSGNPGSPYYADRISEWAAGKYHELQFLKAGEKPTGKFITETIQPGR